MPQRSSFGIRVLVIAIAVSAFGAISPAQDRDSKHNTTVAPTKRPAKSRMQSSDILESALVESYSLGTEFQTEVRVEHLMALCSTAAEARSLGAKQREWTEELFRIAGELPSGDALRTRGQSAAVSCMASANPKRALQLFDALEAPAKADTDPRQWVARVAFAKVLEQQGVKAIPTLRQRARKLGDSGPYPYYAMVPVMAKLKDQPEKAELIFRDALGYFRQNKDPVTSDLSYVSFLRSVYHMKVIPDWLMHEAAEELASHAVRAADSVPEPDSTGGVNRFQFYFRSALSLLQSIDPELAKDLKAQEPSLARRPNVGNPASRDTLPDSDTAAHHVDPDLAKLNAHIDELVNRMMSMGEDGLQNSSEMRDTISEAISGGMKETERAIELSPADEHALKRNPPALLGAVRAAARIAPEFTLQSIETIHDSELKAYLLIEFANAVQELNYMNEMESTPEATFPDAKVTSK